MTTRLATFTLIALTLLAAVCLRVLHGLVWRDPGKGPDWRLFVDGEPVGV